MLIEIICIRFGAMLQNFSPIQNHILSKLKNAKTLRYSELYPKNVPNDLFNYHLQFLVKKGFVSKQDEGYGLADLGVRYVADLIPVPTQAKIASLFKINVITIVSRIVDGKLEILNQLRRSNPSYGKVGVMGGVVLKGESTVAAATRKLKEETGLEADFKIIGIERRMMYTNEELFSDVIFPIAYADSYRGELNMDSDFGHNMWVPIEVAIKNEMAEFDSIVKIVDVLVAIKKGMLNKLPFFYEEDIQKQ